MDPFCMILTLVIPYKCGSKSDPTQSGLSQNQSLTYMDEYKGSNALPLSYRPILYDFNLSDPF